MSRQWNEKLSCQLSAFTLCPRETTDRSEHTSDATWPPHSLFHCKHFTLNHSCCFSVCATMAYALNSDTLAIKNKATELFPVSDQMAVMAARTLLGVSVFVRQRNCFFNLCREWESVCFWSSYTKHPQQQFHYQHSAILNTHVLHKAHIYSTSAFGSYSLLLYSSHYREVCIWFIGFC